MADRGFARLYGSLGRSSVVGLNLVFLLLVFLS